MWVERILGNVADAIDPSTRLVDPIDVHWDECGRTLDKRSRGGLAVRVLLPPGNQIHHGDILFENAQCRVVVNVLPCEVIAARPGAAREMGALCLELGNLHWPAQITDGEVLFVEDGPPMAVVEQLKVPWSRETRRFEPAPIGIGPGVQLARGFKIVRSGPRGS